MVCWTGKKKKKKYCSASPRPSPRCSFKENKVKITRRIYIPRRYGGLGPSRVRTRIPWTRRIGQWVSLHKILRFRVRLQLSQSLVASLFSWRCLAASTFSFLQAAMNLPLTLRDRLNPHLILEPRRCSSCSRNKTRCRRNRVEKGTSPVT